MNRTPQSLIVAVVGVIVCFILAGFFGLALAGREADNLLSSVSIVAAPTIVAFLALLKGEKNSRIAEANNQLLQNVSTQTNGTNTKLLNDKNMLEAQILELGHTPITHADYVSSISKGRHSDG